MIFKELDSSYAGRLHKFAQSKYPGSKLESQGPHHLRIADSPSKLKAETLGRKKHSNQKWKVHQVWGRKNIIFKCRKISSKINGTKNEFIRILREVIFSHHFLSGEISLQTTYSWSCPHLYIISENEYKLLQLPALLSKSMSESFSLSQMFIRDPSRLSLLRWGTYDIFLCTVGLLKWKKKLRRWTFWFWLKWLPHSHLEGPLGCNAGLS